MTMTKKHRPFVIAVDGPAAAGKGTLTRGLATHLGYERLDSGKLYRSVALRVADEWNIALSHAKNDLPKIVSPDSNIAAIAQMTRTHLPLTRAYLADLETDHRLNEDRIALLASRLAPHGALRAVLRDQQRAYIASVVTGIVLDGRDMGTVVFPDAPCKIFLTASLEERAKRRTQQLLDDSEGGNYNVQLNTVLEAMRVRDERDASRLEAPLREAEDAMIIDSSRLSLEQVLAQALHHVETCRMRFVS